MRKITLDNKLLAQLKVAEEAVEVCDESGQLVGYFHAATDRDLYAIADPQITGEELDRREQQTETYTTKQVIEHLRKLK